MKRAFFAISVALTISLTACSNDEVDGEDAIETTDVAAPVSAVTISDAYIMPPFKGRDVAAGFFTANNAGVDDRLVAATTPIAGSVEIHTHSEVDGVMAMRKIEGVDLPNGTSVEFRPGSYHLMMFGVDLAEEVTEAPLTLTYASGQSQTLTLPIRR